MTRIAVIADLHVDNWNRWAVDPLTAQGLDIVIHQRQPDLLVIAGDVANDPVRNWPGILSRLGRLIALEKVVIVPGNHDYYGHRLDGDHVLREEQRVLWSIAEDVTRAEGVEFDLHFPAVYAGDFTDRIKVILGGKVAPLRDLLAAARDPKTHEK